MILTFFGLTHEYKLEIADSIFSMITYGKGGWTYNDLYNMPVFMRLYYMRKLADTLHKENDASRSSSPSSTIMKPNISRG